MTGWNVHYVSKEQLFENAKKIFNTVQADISTAITKYLGTHVYVFFKDHKFFAYLPFDELDYTDYFYNMFITDAIDFIIIADADNYILYTDNRCLNIPDFLYVSDYVFDTFARDLNYYYVNIHLDPDEFPKFKGGFV